MGHQIPEFDSWSVIGLAQEVIMEAGIKEIDTLLTGRK